MMKLPMCKSGQIDSLRGGKRVGNSQCCLSEKCSDPFVAPLLEKCSDPFVALTPLLLTPLLKKAEIPNVPNTIFRRVL